MIIEELFITLFGVPYALFKGLSEKGSRAVGKMNSDHYFAMENEFHNKYGEGEKFFEGPIEKSIKYDDPMVQKFQEFSKQEFGTIQYGKDMLLASVYGIIPKKSRDYGYKDPLVVQWIFDHFKGGIDWDVFCEHSGTGVHHFYWMYTRVGREPTSKGGCGQTVEVIDREQLKKGVLWNYKRPDYTGVY